MTTTTELTMSIADIADRCQLSPRQVNNYRAAAENRLGQKLGQKIGKTWYYAPEEVREILKSREAGNAGTANVSGKFSEATNFSNANNAAEDSTLSGMEGIVAATDQRAIAIGQAIGERFTSIMWTTAISAMQGGMLQVGQQLDEMYGAVALPLNDQPQLPGSNPNTPRLQG